MAYSCQNRQTQRGITLVELLIVLVILGILVGVALPAYQNQIIRGNRAAAQAVMLDIANRQQQRFLSDRSYANKATLESSGFSLDPDVARNYTYTITLGTGVVPTYVMTFSPTGSQAKDGNLTLNEQGVGTPADKWNR
ncbi:MAG: type IV pilin protein [Haliea sp.]|jgi:type IV pilus assembly protein PilE